MKNSESTPLMDQYLAIKSKHPDAILLYRMGDFYETFYEDAKITSKVLGIVLTSRAHGKSADVPLAGFPYHALDTYLPKLIKAGYRVAICEQTEDPKFAKTIVKRDVIEIVTPGSTLSDKIIDQNKNNYLVALYQKEDLVGISLVDVSTGEFNVGEIRLDQVKQIVQSIHPSEIVVGYEQYPVFSEMISLNGAVFSKTDDWVFHLDYAVETLKEHFHTHSLKGFGVEHMSVGLVSAGAVLNYLKQLQKNDLPHLTRLSIYDSSDWMYLDPVTKRNLEIIHSLDEAGSEGTLISILDRTRNSLGTRLLKRWIEHPLKKLERILPRQQCVGILFKLKVQRKELQELLNRMADLERLGSRISTGKATPRDLVALKQSLRLLPEMIHIISQLPEESFGQLSKTMTPLDEIVGLIQKAIQDDPPLVLTEGGVIKDGYHSKLDELRGLAFHAKDWIAKLQATERQRTGINSLRVNYNRIFGYYIEITKANYDKIPSDYIRKQTLVNSERFITPELKEYEEKILGAEEMMTSLETELFHQVRQKIIEQIRAIQQNAEIIAQLDCLCSLAQVAEENNYCKPSLNEEDGIIIDEGRHPVVEKYLRAGESFIPNDLRINNSTDQILIITGPNMAGKSTYLRQVGLIVLMAQLGSFVPAKRAQIGIVDRIFTRVGANDNLTSGESTFLVEMNELANILNNATPKSLILLDEIGRGTSTFDGLSIAWAVVEHLHQETRVASKTLFATHYHEMTELELILPRVQNYNIAVREVGDKIVFLRKIIKGGSDHSYGIQVARMAGIPKEIIERAREVLFNLEANELTPNSTPKLALHSTKKGEAIINQISIFEEEGRILKEAIRKIDLNQMSPIEALNKLNELKKMLE